MSGLLLRLAGPMQSWGTQSRFSVRDTGLEPSKSGVLGLLCAALGRSRAEPLDDLLRLAMAVRVDREGRMARDYHTALGVLKADRSGTGTVVSSRYYLADADFLVALHGERALLTKLHAALARPRWPLYLGRKSFAPSCSVWLRDGLSEAEAPRQALERYPWRPPRRDPPQRLRLVLEVPPGQGEPRQDVPLSFAARRFTVRHVTTTWLDTEPLPRLSEELPCS
jgi:CRISPR system Cascade subunit CasD